MKYIKHRPDDSIRLFKDMHTLIEHRRHQTPKRTRSVQYTVLPLKYGTWTQRNSTGYNQVSTPSSKTMFLLELTFSTQHFLCVSPSHSQSCTDLFNGGEGMRSLLTSADAYLSE
jgi:hypothetical protein